MKPPDKTRTQARGLAQLVLIRQGPQPVRGVLTGAHNNRNQPAPPQRSESIVSSSASQPEPQATQGHSPTTGVAWGKNLDGQLRERVTNRFFRLTGQRAIAVPLAAEDPRVSTGQLVPVHPLCTEGANSRPCLSAWQAHSTALRDRRGSAWHRCAHGRFCALTLVPDLLPDNAALRLVCPDSIGRRTFERHVELLEILVENCVLRAGAPPANAAADPKALPAQRGSKPPPGEQGQPHPLVTRALAYIDANLGDPHLSVTAVAVAVGSHPDYLAHLFARHTGRRMSRHITDLRVARARRLLETTDWQVKRIAWECGFANANWFSHIFHQRLGQTPSAHRRKAQRHFSQT